MSENIERKAGPSNDTNAAAFVRWYCLFLMVIRSIFSSRLQNILTLLTMAIGSMTLAATLFVSEGARLKLWEDLDHLMGNRVVVRADPGPNNSLLEKRPSVAFTTEDLAYVEERLNDARYVVPRFFGKSDIEYQDTHFNMPVDGIAAKQESEPFFHPLYGRGFSDQARKALIWECFITEEAAAVLNVRLDNNPTIRIDNRRFHIVGIVPDPPEADSSHRSRVVVPFSAAQLIWGRPGFFDTIVVSWDNPDKMESTIEVLRNALDEVRSTGAYYMSSSQFKLKKRKNIVLNFMALGTSQALFSIIVASMGVVNVMLANVIRRMREFAIRVAMGARHGDLVFLVLSESFMLGLIGSVVGIVIALLISPVICDLIGSKILEASQLQPYIDTKGILIPIAVCSISGLIAGIIPAVRVKQLDILSHLRAE